MCLIVPQPPILSNPRLDVTSSTSYSGRTLLMTYFSRPAPNGKGASPRNPYGPNVVIKCYKYDEEGQKSNVCPKQRATNFSEEVEDEGEQEIYENTKDEGNIIHGYKGERLVLCA